MSTRVLRETPRHARPDTRGATRPEAPCDEILLLRRFEAVAEETRLRVLRRLSGGERCVCELQDELGAAQSRLSFHLRKLKEAGLVRDRREGRWMYYSLVPEALEELGAVLSALGSEARWAPPASRDPRCCD